MARRNRCHKLQQQQQDDYRRGQIIEYWFRWQTWCTENKGWRYFMLFWYDINAHSAAPFPTVTIRNRGCCKERKSFQKLGLKNLLERTSGIPFHLGLSAELFFLYFILKMPQTIFPLYVCEHFGYGSTNMLGEKMFAAHGIEQDANQYNKTIVIFAKQACSLCRRHKGQMKWFLNKSVK